MKVTRIKLQISSFTTHKKRKTKTKGRLADRCFQIVSETLYVINSIIYSEEKLLTYAKV